MAGQGKGMAVTGQAGIERIPPAMDDPGPGQEDFDQAQELEIGQRFLDYAFDALATLAELLQQFPTETINV